MARCRGHDDAVIGRVLGDALPPVTNDDSNRGEPRGLEIALRGFGELAMALDGDDVAREVRQEGRLETEARAHLEYPAAGAQLERIDHASYERGLARRLFDRKPDGPVAVGLPA